MSQANCLVAQSGGPTCAINASLAGVIAQAIESKEYQCCYGAVNGILGILNENYLNLSEKFEDHDMLHRLIHSPAMYLGTCRYRLPDFAENEEPYQFIFNQFEKLSIKAFFYIGGNDSMDTVLKLSNYAAKINSDIRIIGIPKTIDNDLCMTDHTPGFGSAAKYIASTMLEVAHDTFIYNIKSVTIVEIMGRDAGWLTASAALARNGYNDAPHLIYFPERPFDKNAFLEDVRAQLAVRNNVIIAVSEGIHDAEGNYIAASMSAVDQFGHQQLSGVGKALEYLVKDEIGVKVRSVEISVLQRCAAHITSETDITESYRQGMHAVELAEEGVTASMVCLNRVSDTPYKVEYSHAAIAGIANEVKSIPDHWINEAGNDVTPELITYLLPLIQGEDAPAFKNGIPEYMDISHLTKM